MSASLLGNPVVVLFQGRALGEQILWQMLPIRPNGASSACALVIKFPQQRHTGIKIVHRDTDVGVLIRWHQVCYDTMCQALLLTIFAACINLEAEIMVQKFKTHTQKKT